MKLRYRTVVLLSVLLIPILLLIGSPALVEIPFYLITGWIVFLKDTLPQITIDRAAVGLAFVALALLITGIHLTGRRWFRLHTSTNSDAASPDLSHWRFRWTASLVAVLMLAFTAGISVVGAVHQVMWIGFSSERLVRNSFDSVIASINSKNNLVQLGRAAHNYHDRHHVLPAGATVDDGGRPLHSWATYLLPFMDHEDLAGSVKMSVPWNDDANFNSFQTVVPELLNAHVIAVAHSADGYALSHYAANLHVFGFNRAQSLKEITDGTSQTIFIGEVNVGFRAWGDPLNLRDPTIGLKSPDGFGSPYQDARESQTNFLMGDGSVRTIHADIDPATLRAISTPSSGDRAGEFNSELR